MPFRNSLASAPPHLGGKSAVILFVVTLLGFTIESQLTQYVQTNLHYRQPLFIFYIVHSSFSFIFPLHLLYLSATTDYTISGLLSELRLAVANHLSSKSDSRSSACEPRPFPKLKSALFIIALTIGITLPAVLWFAAIPLAPVSDVTAIWNTNAFFVYLISIKAFGLKLEIRKMVAVVLATAGVVLVVCGRTAVTPKNQTHAISNAPSAPVFGNLLTLVASFSYGLYQVLYKMYVALPNDSRKKERSIYQSISGDEESEIEHEFSRTTNPLPFALFPNLMTTLVGLATGIFLWVFVLICDRTGIEIFRLPKDGWTVLCIAGIALSGTIFNSGLMVLLGIWGPIVTSVGNLMTIVLVFISDLIFGFGMDTLTVWSLIGCSAIVFAFAVLSYDMFIHPSDDG